MKHKFGVGIIVLDETETSVYLSERLGSVGKGLYSSPGGMMEPGETTYETGARELKEETGLIRSVYELKHIGMTSHVGQKSDFTHWLLTKLNPGEQLRQTEPTKHSPWEKLSFDEALGKNLWLNTRLMIEKLKDKTLIPHDSPR